MLEKIKKLLDSGCWVAVEYEMFGKEKTFYSIIYGECEGDFIGEMFIVYKDVSGKIYLEEDRKLEDIKITSIQPIARPLYQYKVGDKVVVLENYEGKYLIFGEIVEITNIWNGTIEVEKNKDIYSIDTRCIAPVLD